MRQRRTKSRGTNASVARFQVERRALRKVQVHFEFQQSLMRKVRLAAAEENLSYADYVRKLVGLPYAKIQRPRISLSFGEQDLGVARRTLRGVRRRARGTEAPCHGRGGGALRGRARRAGAIPGAHPSTSASG